MNLTHSYQDIAQCNRCGFCQTACPVFRSTGHESGVARGRLALLRAIIENRLDWSKELEDPLFDCLLCGACTANCFPAIPTSDLIIRARAEYLDRVGRKPIHRLLFDTLLPYPNRLHWAARSIALSKKAGLSDLAQAVGLLKIFGQDAIYTAGMLERLSIPAFRTAMQTGEYPGRGKTVRIGYFVGCGTDILSQGTARATLQTLRHVGRTVHVLGNSCCGLPAQVYGDLGAARRLAERNLQILTADPTGIPDLVVTDCSSCASFLKSYPLLLAEGSKQRRLGEIVARRAMDMVEFLALNPVTESVSEGTESMTVTYHDPCHAVRGQGLRDEPRNLLQRLPGIEFREMPEADWCCGGAGAYALSHRDLSRRVLDRKMGNLRKTGADMLVTSCPACIIHLSYGIRLHGLNTEVCHISEIASVDGGHIGGRSGRGPLGGVNQRPGV